MQARDLGPLVRMMQHVPRRQLARRAWLQAKRRARVALERAAPGRVRSTIKATPRPIEQWPAPLFALDPEADATVLGHDVHPRNRLDWAPDWAPPNTLERIRLHEQGWVRALEDQELLAVMNDWIAAVPPYQGAYWVAGWNAYALSVRVVAWMQELARRRPDAALDPVYDSLVEQLGFLHRNLETDLGGNHLIKNIVALRWGAACFEGPDASAWASTADALLTEQLPLQVPDDGLHFEGSPAYHLQVMEDLLHLHHVMPEGALRDELGAALDRMAAAARFTTAPDGAPVLLGDGGQHMARSPDALVEAWAGAGGTDPALPSVVALADAGLYAYRSEGDLVVVDAGPLAAEALPGHGHADALSILWSLGGRRFLIDQGTYEYQGETRDFARSTAAHNTLTLDDEDQAELFGVFRAGRRWSITRHAWMPRADGFVLTASHDGFAHLAGSPVHRRTVEVKGRRVRVEDRVEGGSGQRAVARLLLHPDVQVRVLGSGAILSRDDLKVDLRTTAAVREVEAVWWPDFGVEVPTRRLELDLGRAPCSARFTLEVQKR